MLSRSLSYAKIVQGECNKNLFLIAEPKPILCKDSARRTQNKACFSFAEPKPILCKDTIKKDTIKIDNQQKLSNLQYLHRCDCSIFPKSTNFYVLRIDFF